MQQLFSDLESDYEAMAKDARREEEAIEWAEAFITGDLALEMV